MQTLYFGGDIITMKGRESIYSEAVLVEEGKIKYEGDLDMAKKLCNEDTSMYDLQGKTLLPAFIDPHSHISLMAQFSDFANLSECTSFDDIVDVLTHYKIENNITEDGVIFGVSYDHNFLIEGTHPNKDVLDRVSSTIPIYIFHTSGHMGVGNTAMLELAGIDENTKDPQGGRFGRVNGSNEPDGYAEETTASGMMIYKAYGRVKTDFTAQILKAQAEYLRNGITTVQDGAATEMNVEVIAQMAQNKLLNIDVVSYVLANKDIDKTLEKYSEYDKKYSNHLKIGGYKVVLDGSPQGRSAWLTKPYEGEEEYRGYAAEKDEVVLDNIKSAMESNHQILAHCNGDAASDQFIKLYTEALNTSTNDNKTELRPVMIHCQTVRKDQLQDMAKIGMIPSIFMAHTYYWGDVHLKNLGEERGNKISPAKTAFDLGLKVNFHQDAPVVKADMLHTVWCAVNRITRGGTVIGEDERVDVYDALLAVTTNGAYEYFEEDQKGTIEAGKRADLVILDANPLKVDKIKIRDIKVLETIKDGRVLYKL